MRWKPGRGRAPQRHRDSLGSGPHRPTSAALGGTELPTSPRAPRTLGESHSNAHPALRCPPTTRQCPPGWLASPTGRGVTRLTMGNGERTVSEALRVQAPGQVRARVGGRHTRSPLHSNHHTGRTAPFLPLCPPSTVSWGRPRHHRSPLLLEVVQPCMWGRWQCSQSLLLTVVPQPLCSAASPSSPAGIPRGRLAGSPQAGPLRLFQILPNGHLTGHSPHIPWTQ